MNLLEDITHKEINRQKTTLNLIASENYPSPKTLAMLGSVWNDKYAEGYPGKRYYAGNVLADELEEFVCKKALEVYDKTSEYGVNVQVLSGSPANAVVYLTVLEQGDTVLSLDLASGGHLSHLHATSNYLKFFKRANYSLRAGRVNEAEFEHALKEHKPRLVVIGFSSYPAKYEFAKLCRLAHEYGALVLADIAHINGLVASELHDTPFKKDGEGADFVSMTTHKTMRGPRGALLFAKQEYLPVINKTVFPGTSGGPHLNQIASVGQSLLEMTGEDQYPDKIAFSDYSASVVKNAHSLEIGLKESGLSIVTPTQTHLVLAKLPDELDSLDVQNRLEKVGIITNRNAIPDDAKPAWRPSGLRLGTAALTSRGLHSEQARELGIAIGSLILDQVTPQKTTDFVHDLTKTLNWYY